MRTLAAVLLLTGACSKGTFIQVDLDRGTIAADIDSIQFNFTTPSATATASISNASGAPLTFPTAASFEVGGGLTGDVTVEAIAQGAARAELARRSVVVTLIPGGVARTAIAFGASGDMGLGDLVVSPNLDMPQDFTVTDDAGSLTDLGPITCATNNTCPSGVCDLGICVAPTSVAYVNNAGVCTDLIHVSSPSNPYCQVQAAVDVSGKQFIVVAGSATPYAQVSINNGTFRIIGPGKGATPLAQLTAPTAGANALGVHPATGQTTNVTFEGVEMFQALGSGVHCVPTGSGAASLIMRDCSIRACNSGVVALTNCTFTLDSSSITSSGVAVSASGPTTTLNANVLTNNSSGSNAVVGINSLSYTLTNNLIGGNFGFRAVELTNSSTNIAFNTIANNSLTGSSTINCINPGTRFNHSIIAGNTLNSGTQFTGVTCAFTNVVVGSDTTTITGAIKLTPSFVTSVNVHLVAADPANIACCVDKVVSAPGTPNQGFDVDGEARPKGAGWDIGADEVQ